MSEPGFRFKFQYYAAAKRLHLKAYPHPLARTEVIFLPRMIEDFSTEKDSPRLPLSLAMRWFSEMKNAMSRLEILSRMNRGASESSGYYNGQYLGANGHFYYSTTPLFARQHYSLLNIWSGSVCLHEKTDSGSSGHFRYGTIHLSMLVVPGGRNACGVHYSPARSRRTEGFLKIVP